MHDPSAGSIVRVLAPRRPAFVRINAVPDHLYLTLTGASLPAIRAAHPGRAHQACNGTVLECYRGRRGREGQLAIDFSGGLAGDLDVLGLEDLVQFVTIFR